MKKIIYAIAIAIFFLSCQKLTDKTLKFKPRKPQAGSEITLSYDASKGPLAKAEAVEMIYSVLSFQSENFAFIEATEGLKMKKGKNRWEATFTLPKLADIVAVTFESDGKKDNNKGEGYFVKICDEDGKIKEEANLGYATAFKGRGWSIFNAYVKTDNKKCKELMEQCFAKNPSLKRIALNNYLSVLRSATDQSQRKEVFRKEAEQVKQMKNVPERVYSSLIWHLNKLELKEDARQIETLLISKYPNGEHAKKLKKDAMFDEKDDYKKLEIAKELTKGRDFGLYTLTPLDELFNYFVKEKKLKMLEPCYYAILENSESNLAYSYYINQLKKINNITLATKICKEGEKYLAKWIKDTRKGKPAYLTEKKYADTKARIYGYFLLTSSSVYELNKKPLEALKRYEDGLNIFKPAWYKNVNITKYIELLGKTNQYGRAKPIFEECIVEGVAINDATKILKKLYVKEKGTEKGFDSYYSKLAKKGKQKLLEKYEKQLINEVAPNFALKDLEGNEITLSSLKGKTVILDFWATWCGPCKASFPGMQKAVDKYASSNDIEFFFINTFEMGKNRKEKVQKFIKKEKYTFQVLLDDNKSSVGKKYDVSGIPTKIVIDKKGNIRFKIVGGASDVDRIMNGMDVMLELANTSE